jgi:hypothetical protein
MLRPVAPASPRSAANVVTYARGGLTEWWANGPAGLEQGFDIAGHPGARGEPLTLSLALSGGIPARLANGSVSIAGHGSSLAYGDLAATDARGHKLRSWLEVARRRVLIRVDDHAAVYPVRIDPVLTQSARLDDRNGAKLGWFGWSVAVSGNTIVVGAPGDGQQPLKGTAYVFVKPKSGWSGPLIQTGTLTASNGAAYDHFGTSVAISGDTIVVGAPGPSLEAGVPAPAQRDAYVFVKPRRGWAGAHTQTAILTTTSRVAGSYFGYAAAVSGNTVVVSAPSRPVGSHVNQGQAFVFVRPSSGWSGTRVQTATLASSDGAANDVFGWSVAASGNTIAVGAFQHRYGKTGRGEVYVFVRPEAGWSHARTQTATLRGPEGCCATIGDSLALSGDTIVSGSGGAYVNVHGVSVSAAWVFVRPESGWSGRRGPTATLEVPSRASPSTCGVNGEIGADYTLGFSLAISGDTVVATTGAYGSDNHNYLSKACVFSKPASGWTGIVTQAKTLIASNGAGSDLFGTGSRASVAVSGGTVVVGAADHNFRPHRGRGEAYVY